MRNLYKLKYLRKVFIPLLQTFSFDFRVTHPWVKGQKYLLNSFLHKGYWYHGSNREKLSMNLFKKIIKKDDFVIEVGGHIGFISLFFQDIVGSNGSLVIFEPGSNNLPYLKENVKPFKNIEVREKAVGDYEGIIAFYEDGITGQNNSVVENFDGLEANSKLAFVKKQVKKVEVPISKIDGNFDVESINFIKIDIEGGELEALKGAEKTIKRCKPFIMVEIQKNEDEILQFFNSLNYSLFDESLNQLFKSSDLEGNVFCFPKDIDTSKF